MARVSFIKKAKTYLKAIIVFLSQSSIGNAIIVFRKQNGVFLWYWYKIFLLLSKSLTEWGWGFLVVTLMKLLSLNYKN